MRLDENRVAVITGAGSGIGAALAKNLDARGVRLALCDIAAERLHTLGGELRQTPLTARVDIADSTAVHAFADRVRAELGHPDLVFANAGVALTGDFLTGTPEEWNWIVDINLWGVVYTCRAFAPAMVERGHGHLVNISSIFGIIGVPNCAAYCATKAAVRGFSESLDQELSDSGVIVSCVHPGGVATRITEDARFGKRLFGKMTERRSKSLIAKGLPPVRAAEIIIGGVEREKRRILVGRDAWVLDKLQRLFPTRYRDLVRLGSGVFS